MELQDLLAFSPQSQTMRFLVMYRFPICVVGNLFLPIFTFTYFWRLGLPPAATELLPPYIRHLLKIISWILLGGSPRYLPGKEESASELESEAVRGKSAFCLMKVGRGGGNRDSMSFQYGSFLRLDLGGSA